MHRSSESIGAIAAALAKAQAELTNPEKSLVATIRGRDPRDVERTFRYASLASGLEIVRKALGQHEIATVQTTEIDRNVGLIRLTTVLAHSSGEWVSSDWPVCPIADATAPQRMGAALTYARRYALFTLVGIAGEDDLDAPDLSGVQTNGSSTESPVAVGSGRANGHAPPQRSATSGRAGEAGAPRPARPILGLEDSARCRGQLLDEMAAVSTADELTAWAQRVLPTKNTLRNEDAAIVETTFTAKLEELTGRAEAAQTPPSSMESSPEFGEALANSEVREAQPRLGAAAPDNVPRSLAGISAVPDANCAELAFGKTRRRRDKAHRAFVASKPCLVCGRRPADAHHLRFAQPSAMGRKVSDEFTVPLCRLHHRELHLRADETTWWEEYKIDSLAAAQLLWAQTRNPPGDGTAKLESSLIHSPRRPDP